MSQFAHLLTPAHIDANAQDKAAAILQAGAVRRGEKPRNPTPASHAAGDKPTLTLAAQIVAAGKRRRGETV